MGLAYPESERIDQKSVLCQIVTFEMTGYKDFLAEVFPFPFILDGKGNCQKCNAKLGQYPILAVGGQNHLRQILTPAKSPEYAG